MWVTEDAIANWEATPRLTPGGRLRYPDLEIETGLMLGSAFHLALRQAEGLMSSGFGLLAVSLGVPDHTTLSRPVMNLKSGSMGCPLPAGALHLLIDSTGLKVFGAGEWLQEKHGAKARRTWRKLNLAVSIDPRRRTRWRGDAITGMIMASTLTGKDTGDPSQVAPLLDLVDGEIASVTADGAYDGATTYEAVVARAGEIPVIIPPHTGAVPAPQLRQTLLNETGTSH